MRELLLGVDIGTQATKGLLCTTSGDVVASASVSHPTSMPSVGWFEQDGERDWWSDFCRVVAQILATGIDPHRIACVGCSSMTPNMLPLDAEGHPVRAAILYCDSRSMAIYPEILRTVSAEEILQLNGFPLTAHGGWQGGQLLWLRRHEPEVYARTSRVVGTTNYLVYKLTGEFVADYALARCNVPFYDLQRRYWSEDMCHRLQIPVGLFPERIGYSAEIAGHVTAEASRQCGLVEGTAVIFGAMDTNADMVGAGVTEPGQAGLSYGTALIGTKCLAEPYRDRGGGLSNDYVIPNRYLCGWGLNGGALTRWFRDAFGAQEMQQEAAGGPNAFAALSELASSVPPGSDNLILVPIFNGSKLSWNRQLASGAVIGLTTFHGRAHLYRAMLEGTAYEARRQLTQLAPTVAIDEIRSVGGGSKNRAWTSIMSDVLNVRQHCFPDTMGAPYGDAYLAGLGVGIFHDFQPLKRDWNRGGYVVCPRPETREVYERMYESYLEVTERLGGPGRS